MTTLVCMTAMMAACVVAMKYAEALPLKSGVAVTNR